MRLLKFIVVIMLMPTVVNVLSSEIFPPLQKYTSLLTRYLILIALIAASYLGYEINCYMKERRCLLPVSKTDLDLKAKGYFEDPDVARCPHSSVNGRVDPLLRDPDIMRIRNMLDSYGQAKPEGVSSDHISMTIPTELPAHDVPAEFKSKPYLRSLTGSRVLYWQFETGSCDLDDLSVQITQCMRRAHEIDENCTLQFGSFALLKYKDGELQWWRLQNEWIPTISRISRSSRHLLEILAGDDSTWTIRGFNLQNATLKASTMHKSETLKVFHHCKTESGEDEFLCKDPDLLGDSAPMFLRELYIYASSPVEVDGMTVPLQSQPINVKGAYWISVLQGLKHPWSMVIITSLAILWVQLCFGIQYTYIGTFGGLLDKLSWTIVVIIIFNASSWWHRHQPVQPSGYDVERLRIPTLENPPLRQDDLLEETTASDLSMETSVRSQEEGSLPVFPGEYVFSATLTPPVADADVNVTGDIRTVPPPMVESDWIEKENVVEPGDDVLPSKATPASEDCTNVFGSIHEEVWYPTLSSAAVFICLIVTGYKFKTVVTVLWFFVTRIIEKSYKLVFFSGLAATFIDERTRDRQPALHRGSLVESSNVPTTLMAFMDGDVASMDKYVGKDIQWSTVFASGESTTIDQFPGVIRKLVTLLAKDVNKDVQQWAAFALAELAKDHKQRIMIRQFPDVIGRLAALLAQDVSKDVQQWAAFALGELAKDPKQRIMIRQFPDVIMRLVDLLAEDVSKDAQQAAAFALGQLAKDRKQRIMIRHFPDVIGRLGALLAEDVSNDVQRSAAFALGELAKDPKQRIMIRQFPDVIGRLSALLAEDVSNDVQQSAGFALGILG